jgi:hypothetical protein
MFTAAPFTRCNQWNRLRYSSTDEWIKKLWYIYTMEYFPAIKKNENAVFAGK